MPTAVMYTDHPNTEVGMRLRAQARAAGGTEVGIAAHHQQTQPVAWNLGQG
jgi:hypothetical protein